jgi:hypothetical protein
LERKVGGKFHLKLNMDWRPIANKYHEGKVKRTLKRELKVPEIAEGEANGTSPHGEIVERRLQGHAPLAQATEHVSNIVCLMVLAVEVIGDWRPRITPKAW